MNMGSIAGVLSLLLVPMMPVVADDATETVRCAEVAFSRSVETQDLEAFADHVHPEARFIGSQITRGREAVVESWKVFFAENGPRIAWRPQIVELQQDLALSRGPYRVLQVDADGKTVERWGHFNSTWRRGDDGRWRVVFDSGGDDGMTPTDAERALLEADPGCGDGS